MVQPFPPSDSDIACVQLGPGSPSGASILRTVYHEPWWLEAASNGAWEEVSVTSNGVMVARLPYVIKRMGSISGIAMPTLTPFLGPQLPLRLNGQDRKGPFDRELLAELFTRLPKTTYVNQICESRITDALPLYALGYDSTIKYTLQVAPAASMDQIMQGIRPRIRSAIRKAERTLTVQTDLGIEEFCRFYNACTQANNSVRWSPRYARQADAVKTRLYEACRKADAGCLLAARDRGGALRAAIMLVWGHGVMYYFLTAQDASSDGSGSIKLLIWEGLKLAHQRRMIFDFDGFPRPGAVNILSGFGGIVRNRIAVTKMPPLIHFARFIASRSRIGL